MYLIIFHLTKRKNRVRGPVGLLFETVAKGRTRAERVEADKARIIQERIAREQQLEAERQMRELERLSTAALRIQRVIGKGCVTRRLYVLITLFSDLFELILELAYRYARLKREMDGIYDDEPEPNPNLHLSYMDDDDRYVCFG